MSRPAAGVDVVAMHEAAVQLSCRTSGVNTHVPEAMETAFELVGRSAALGAEKQMEMVAIIDVVRLSAEHASLVAASREPRKRISELKRLRDVSKRRKDRESVRAQRSELRKARVVRDGGRRARLQAWGQIERVVSAHCRMLSRHGFPAHTSQQPSAEELLRWSWHPDALSSPAMCALLSVRAEFLSAQQMLLDGDHPRIPASPADVTPRHASASAAYPMLRHVPSADPDDVTALLEGAHAYDPRDDDLGADTAERAGHAAVASPVSEASPTSSAACGDASEGVTPEPLPAVVSPAVSTRAKGEREEETAGRDEPEGSRSGKGWSKGKGKGKGKGKRKGKGKGKGKGKSS